MSRDLSARTAAAPYLTYWDAADSDISSTDADQAPVDITNHARGSDFVTMCFSANAVGASVLSIIAVDESTPADENSDPQPIGSVNVTMTATEAGTSHFDGGGDPFMPAVTADIRGLPDGPTIRYYLALTTLTTSSQVNLTYIAGHAKSS